VAYQREGIGKQQSNRGEGESSPPPPPSLLTSEYDVPCVTSYERKYVATIYLMNSSSSGLRRWRQQQLHLLPAHQSLLVFINPSNDPDCDEHTLTCQRNYEPTQGGGDYGGSATAPQLLGGFVSFSAHVDFVQNRDFITRVNPRVYYIGPWCEGDGEVKGCMMMHYNKLPEVCYELIFAVYQTMFGTNPSPQHFDQPLSSATQNKRPTIAVEVKRIVTRRRSAKIMGKLAEAPATAGDDNDNNVDDDVDKNQSEKTFTTAAGTGEGNYKLAEPREDDTVRGILVTQQNSSKIVSPEDLLMYTPLRVGLGIFTVACFLYGKDCNLEIILE